MPAAARRTGHRLCVIAAIQCACGLPGAAAGQTTLPAPAWRPQVSVQTAAGIRLEFTAGAAGPGDQAPPRGSASVEGRAVHRLIAGTRGEILFGYDVVAEREPGGGAIRIGVYPLDRAYETGIRGQNWFPAGSATEPGGRVRSVAAEKQFRAIEGQPVRLDVFQKGDSGTRIFDEIRATAAPGVSGARLPVDFLRLSAVRLAVNGKPSGEGPPATFVGSAVVLWVPGRGSFYFTLRPPRTFRYQPVGRVVRNRLMWAWGNDSFELTCAADILGSVEIATVWVMFDPERPRGMPAAEAGRLWVGSGFGLTPQ